MSNVLSAMEHSESESGEKIPRREVTRDRTKLKSRCSCRCQVKLIAANDKIVLYIMILCILTLKKSVNVLQLRYVVFSN